jgi:hypothetical protein
MALNVALNISFDNMQVWKAIRRRRREVKALLCQIMRLPVNGSYNKTENIAAQGISADG